MKNSEIPIIFIHFSNSNYLQYTLDLAKKNNLDKRVILLGDKTNNRYKNIGIEHFYFDDYYGGSEVEEFNKVYKFIAGAQKRKKYWTNFVFKRWFCIYNFITENNIQAFWTFDSDTLILTSLNQFEKRYDSIDCTTQCNGSCMNGFINNQRVVRDYVKKINQLFQRNAYLAKQEKDFENHPDWAFTEMRAFASYKNEDNIKTMRSNKIIDDSIFDECICQENGMKMEHKKNYGYKTNVLYYKNGEIFEKSLNNKKMIRLNTINMSWVPLILIEKIYYYNLYKKFPTTMFLLKNYIKKIGRFVKRKI